MRYLLTLTGLPEPSTRALCGNAPDAPIVRSAQVSAVLPDTWDLRLLGAVAGVANVPADLVAQEVNGLTPRTVQRILRDVATGLPLTFVQTIPFGATFPAWGECNETADFEAVIDYAAREVLVAFNGSVECFGFGDLDEWVGS